MSSRRATSAACISASRSAPDASSSSVASSTPSSRPASARSSTSPIGFEIPPWSFSRLMLLPRSAPRARACVAIRVGERFAARAHRRVEMVRLAGEELGVDRESLAQRLAGRFGAAAAASSSFGHGASGLMKSIVIGETPPKSSAPPRSSRSRSRSPERFARLGGAWTLTVGPEHQSRDARPSRPRRPLPVSVARSSWSRSSGGRAG